MKTSLPLLLAGLIALTAIPALSMEEDLRERVKLPEPMQHHLLGNMRKHLEVINSLIEMLGSEDFEEAAALAESELGMSSLEKHGARHIAQYYPERMQQIGTSMHKAASRFARTAMEGDLPAANRALAEITRACTNCHASYRIR